LPTEDILLYAGRVAREKNLEFLVRAFERIVSVRPRTRLVIAGDGPYRTTLEASVREWGLEELVIFTGFLNRSDLISFYQQATLFVFPSMTDTQGLVVMEAMMAGAAVVAVNVLGPVDVIQNGITGVLANPTVHEFSAACLCLLDDRETRRRMGGAARRWARNHSSRNSAEKLMEIYRLAGAKH
jgi:glycosyltransferase involved in cell wall biosynthesis